MKKQYDFRYGRRGAVLRAPSGKTRITIRIDDDVLQWFRDQVHKAGGAAIRRSSMMRSVASRNRPNRISKVHCVVCCEKSCPGTRSSARPAARADDAAGRLCELCMMGTRADTPKRIKHLLREYAGAAHEEELRRALVPVAEAFQRGSAGRSVVGN